MAGAGWTRVLVPLLVAGALGCDAPLPLAGADEGPSADAASRFDPAGTGTLTGRVVWEGEVPKVSPFQSPVSPLSELPTGPKQSWPNPHAPAVDPRTRGVAGAVVFLRGVDPSRARPWDHPPVCVELRDLQIHICQGESDSRVGFVRRGGVVTAVSRQPAFDSLQARGAAFFTLAFPDPDRPRTRRLPEAGVVELGSGVGHFWMRGYLFVSDHPYLARTDAEGRFTLPQVPGGRYELIAWLPDWREAAHERDADTCLISRLLFRPPLEKVQAVEVAPGASTSARVAVSAADFDP
jgi:hypothetical protein